MQSNNIGYALFLSLLIIPLVIQAQQKPERVIVFLIDGLHWQAPKKLDVPVFNSLVKEGTYVEKSYMIIPHHPTVGEYGKLHTSSFPNPVLQSGTLFVKPKNKYLQQMFSPEHQTAFVANSRAYVSVSDGFTINIHDPNLSDEEVVEQSLNILKKQDIKYFRIHLQTAGNEGRYLSYTDPDKPYYRNIWGEDSPYIKTVETADQLLGRLIEQLKSAGKWKSTLLIVSSDQGQSEIGWHPIIDEDSWRVPLVFRGPGIAKGRTLSYIEHTDLTPTIAHLMNIDLPNKDGGTGQIIEEVKKGVEISGFKHPRYIKTINQQINEYNKLRSQIILASEANPYFSSLLTFLENELLTPEPFYHQDRFLEWYKAGSTDNLIEANKKILDQMKKELNKNQ